jgi:predicted chitinase
VAVQTENKFWQVGAGQLERIAVPGTNIVIPLQAGPVGRVMRAFCADFHAYVESLYNARGGTDEGGWTPTNSVWNSNHLSGTAVDLNWSDHTFRVSYAGFTPDEIARCREVLDFYEGTIFWGQDWNSPKDAMHFQIGYNVAGTRRLEDFIARKVRADGFSTFKRGGTGTIPPAVSDVVWLGRGYESTGDRVRQLQVALNATGANLDADGDFGPLTEAAVMKFQLDRGLMVDGIAGPDTLKALGLTFGGGAGLPAAPVLIGGRGLSPVVLARIMDHRVSDMRYMALNPKLIEAFDLIEATTVRRRAHFLAQLGHESGGLKYQREIASGAAYEGRKDLGNTQPGDGVRFAGRDFIQITGRSNYTALSAWAHQMNLVPTPTYFVDNPAQLETDRYAFVGAVWYWITRKRNGKTLNQLADANDIEEISKAVNGVNKSTGRANGIGDRIAFLNRALAEGDNLLDPDYDPWEEFLMSNTPFATASHFRRDNLANLSPMEAMRQTNAMTHESMVWDAFDAGEQWAIQDVAYLAYNPDAPGSKDHDGAWWVNRARGRLLALWNKDQALVRAALGKDLINA